MNNRIKEIDLVIKNMENFKKFSSNFTKNLLSKNNINDMFNMDNSQFENYINKLKKNLDKYNFNNSIKEVFIKSVKNSYNLKDEIKGEIKSKYFESAKKEIDDLCKTEKKDVKENYFFYMVKIGLIFKKYIDLNIYEKNRLMKYFFEKKNISKKEYLILNLNFIIKLADKMILNLKSEKEQLIKSSKLQDDKLDKDKSKKEDKSTKDKSKKEDKSTKDKSKKIKKEDKPIKDKSKKIKKEDKPIKDKSKEIKTKTKK
jgi:hypothetical protein